MIFFYQKTALFAFWVTANPMPSEGHRVAVHHLPEWLRLRIIEVRHNPIDMQPNDGLTPGI